MADTYLYFSFGFIAFLAVSFGGLGMLMRSVHRIEKSLDQK